MYRLFVVVFLAVSAHAKTPEEIKNWFMQLGLECNKDFPITPEEMLMLQRHKIPESKNVKCLLACVYKKTKWLNAEGTFDAAKPEEMMEQEFGDKAELKANGKKVMDACRSVNDQTVSDGAEGCERSYLLTHCLIEQSPKYGFDLKHVHL